MSERYKCDLSAEKILFKAYEKKNRDRNRILTIVTALSICLTFCMISLAYGKLRADVLKNIRADGTTAAAYLENGTEEQTEQLAGLSYVSVTGKEKTAGKLTDGLVKYCDCVVLEKTAYEEIVMPAYADIHGAYPKETDEIMLSVKTLNYLGIEAPEVGMTLELNFYWNDLFNKSLTGKQEFVLAGYFTEYKNQATDASIAYISEQRMREGDIDWTPCSILIKGTKDAISGETLEHMLNRDVPLGDNQQFVCMDSAAYQAAQGLFGSYGMAMLFSLLVLLCMFLFVYNVLNISMSYDIREYGLLGVLGVTNRQIFGLVCRQMLKSALTATVIGGGAGSFLVVALFSDILAKMYMENMGAMESRSVYHAGFLILSIVLNLLAFVCAVLLTMRKLRHLSPLGALKYEENDGRMASGQKKWKMPERTRRWMNYRGNPVPGLAWIHFLKNKRTMLLTVISLILGCETALCSAMLVDGVDLRNKFLMNPDFEAGLTQNACITLIENSPDTHKMKMFSEGVIEEIRTISAENEGSFREMKGFIPILDREGSKSVEILQEGRDCLTIIQSVEASDMDKLEAYIKTCETAVDLETFLNGNGAILIHRNRMTDNAIEASQRMTGMPIGIYDLVPTGTDMSGMESVFLQNCGYLNIADKDFPEMDFCWDGEDTNILLICENTFHRLSETLTEQTFQISFDVDHDRETTVKSRLKRFIRMQNTEFQSKGYSDKLNLLYLDCNSDLIAEEENYITSSRLVLSIVSMILIFVGIANYLNTRVTDLILRRKENALLECVGLTKKELYKMLTTEGFYYWIIVIGLLSTAGTGILLGQGYYMKSKITYFVFRYPVGVFLTIAVLLFIFCILLPRVIYQKINKM